MQILRTILIIVLSYYVFKVIRRLFMVTKSNGKQNGSKSQKARPKSKKRMSLKDVEDADFEEIKD